jgi:hypothetical protein
VLRGDTAPDDANAWYADLGLGVARRRVEQIVAGDPAIVLPAWLRAAIAAEG